MTNKMMMTGALTLNSKTRAIEMTKAFEKASSIIGSEEYSLLQQARRDYPNYKVVTITRTSKSASYKGLDLAFMEMYIKAHDDDEKTIMANFKMLRAQGEEFEGTDMRSESFLTIRAWFLEQYPEVTTYYKKSEKAMKNLQEKREEALKAKREALLMERRKALLAQIAEVA